MIKDKAGNFKKNCTILFECNLGGDKGLIETDSLSLFLEKSGYYNKDIFLREVYRNLSL